MGNDIKTRTITYEGIIKVVADHYNVKQDELFNKKRTQNIAFPRQVAMYLCRGGRFILSAYRRALRRT